MIINRYDDTNLESDNIFSSNTYITYIRILKFIIQKLNFKNNTYIQMILKKLNYEEQKINIGFKTDRLIKYFFKKKNSKIPLFDCVEIETINRCNGICPFCPVNKKDDTRKFKLMKKELFESIVSQLKNLDFKGRISLFSNNEPFLDSRIIEFAQYARQQLPQAYMIMYTNGTLLTLDKFKNIIPYLDKLIIDNYNDNLVLNNNIKEIDKYCKNNTVLNRKVEIHLRKINEILTTRGGQSPNNKKRKTVNISCSLPFRQIVIRPDGKLSLCCNDALGKYTMGDLNKQSLIEIWNSKKYEIIRNKLKKARKNISLCKYCDSLFY